MAGKSENSQPAGGGAPKASVPRVKNFECPSCGASITIRTPGLAMSCICDSCHSVIDVSDENYRILRRYFEVQKKYLPSISLGARGKLQGKLWEMIGYMVRADKASGFAWEEYLLFNPYYGYRWLTQSEGHWNLVRTVKEKPSIGGRRSYETASLGKQEYRIFYRGEAVVKYVIGEFYWRVRVDSTVRMADYIDPPFMLSLETDLQEVVWARSEYIDQKEVMNAFRIGWDNVHIPRTIGPNQPSRNTRNWKEISKLWILFFAFLTVAEIAHVAMSSSKELLRQSYSFVPNSQAPEVTTPVFTIDKDASNLRLSFSSDMDNSWCYVSGELVNNETGQSYPFERTCEYYHGYEDGESWSEGSNSQDVLISSVPKGQYYLNIDEESGNIPNLNLRNYRLVVVSDVPTYANYFWCLLFISIIPILSWISSHSDEVQRWSQSDFSPYSSGD